jgi:Flp pilus assembly pilin Flp
MIGLTSAILFVNSIERRHDMTKLWNLVKGDDGLESGEYALLGFLILVVIIGAVTLLGQRIDTVFRAIVTGMGG